jgi:hypothetical protein
MSHVIIDQPMFGQDQPKESLDALEAVIKWLKQPVCENPRVKRPVRRPFRDSARRLHSRPYTL